jgi:outer membrane protein, multidrug efflux system
VLAGEIPGIFSVPQQEWSAILPAIPPGLPSSVLARRPDVLAAQQAVQAAQSRLGIASDAWFPQLTLSGSAGLASPTLGNVLEASMRAWSVGALLSLPLFDGGRREAGVANAQGELGATLALLREQMLVALREVQDQLSALHLLADQAQVHARSMALGSRARQLAESRYRSGFASQLDLLEAQRSELAAQRAAVQLRSAQYQASVALVRALGGGWDDPSAK